MNYDVWFEDDGRIYKGPMIYVAHPGEYVILGELLYLIEELVWTPGRECHYVLRVKALGDAPKWAPKIKQPTNRKGIR